MIAVNVARNPTDFDCKTCNARHCDDSNPAPFARWKIDGLIESTTCLLPMITAFSRECLRLYGHYKNGRLPYAGGLYNQPRRYLQAMETLDHGYQQARN
jgi:hypothetical protein